MTTPAAPPPYAAWIRAYVRRAVRVDSGGWVWEAAVRVVEEETE